MSKTYRHIAVAFLLVLLLLSFWGGYWFRAAPPKKPLLGGSFQNLSIDVNNLRRNYHLYVPKRVKIEAPLVFVLHGSSGDGVQARKAFSYQFDRLADEHGFIVVYPDGYENHWNDCRIAGPYSAKTLNIDDVRFLNVLQRSIRKTYELMGRQTLITGISNGGQMVLRMALESPDDKTVYVPVIANMPAPGNMGCTQKREPVDIAFLNGMDDPLNPREGGEVALYGVFFHRGEVLSSEDSVNYWLKLAGLENASTLSWLVDNNADDSSQIRIKQWYSAGKPQIGLYAVEGGGHTVPSKLSREPRILGRTNHDVDAAELIWQFFSEAGENLN